MSAPLSFSFLALKIKLQSVEASYLDCDLGDIIDIFMWFGLADKLSADDLNALIAHAHRRIDQLNRALAEQKALRSSIALALEKQKLEESEVFDSAVAKALEHHRSEIQAEQDRKVKK